MNLHSILLLGVALILAPSPGRAQIRPLVLAHAHNDYEHARPLHDALARGFCSVESDVWLVDGQLLVAHDLPDAKPGRTLQSLYLDPLRRQVATNDGRVFRGGPSITLLIDVKSEATNTYRAIRAALQPYRPMLTVFHEGRIQTNAVTVVISGNRARALMAAERERLAAYDGRLSDLDTEVLPQFCPLISDNWRLHFRWKAGPADGPLSDDERARLKSIVQRTHARGMRIRFWGMPDTRLVWETLKEAGVDLINTDDLDGLAAFLKP